MCENPTQLYSLTSLHSLAAAAISPAAITAAARLTAAASAANVLPLPREELPPGASTALCETFFFLPLRVPFPLLLLGAVTLCSCGFFLLFFFFSLYWGTHQGF